MANEAVILSLQKGQNPVRFTVADGTGVEKGTLMQISDPVTASASDGDNVFAGIASTEKVASDGQTTLGLWVQGQGNKFDLTIASGGSATCGAMVKLSGANLIDAASDADYEAGKVVGKALETGSSDEVIAVLV